MFKTHIPLKFSDHHDLRVFESNDYSFAKAETLAPITLPEIGEIAREYPIIFRGSDIGLPCALLGIEPGRNAYVAEDGRWSASYIPAHIRRYPFMLARTGEQDANKDRFVVVLDPDAPHFRDPSGHPVFEPDGQPTQHMENRFALLQDIQKDIPRTTDMVKIITEAGILVERKVTIRKQSGTNQITGLRVIDEKALNDLPDSVFSGLRRAGVLPLIYAHLLSWANFRQGPIGGKYPDLMSKASKGDEPFFFEDETLDFSQFS